jgi:hypothetical protein
MASSAPIEGRCAAHVNRSERNPDGGFCEKWPLAGQRRCGTHGGASPQAKAAADRRRQEASVAALAVTYGLPVEIDPVDALLGELWRTQGAVLWLQAQIADLAPEEIGWGQTEVKTVNSVEFGGTDTTEAAAINVLVQLYQRERQHLAKVSRDCVSVGIELKLAQRMDAIASDVMSKLAVILRALGHDPEDRQVLRLVVNVLRGMPPQLEAGAA